VRYRPRHAFCNMGLSYDNAPKCSTVPARKTPNNFDLLTAVEAWLERGKALNKIVASHVAARPGERNPPLSMSVAGTVDRTRPISAYPKMAAYKGTGNIDEATSITCKP
jgi:feruloyl esterase